MGVVGEGGALGAVHVMGDGLQQQLVFALHVYTKSLVLFGGWQAACRLDCYKIP
jgi:hypothetical protein